MLDFNFEKSENGWPVTASLGDAQFSFSGAFSRSRISKERTSNTLGKATDILLWVILVLALGVAGLEGYRAVPQGNYLYLLQHSALNAVFWIGMLTTLYLWTRAKQQDLDEQKLNVLKLDAGSAASVDVYELFNQPAKRAWNRAFDVAAERKAPLVTHSDLLIALLEDKSCRHAFWRLGVDPGDISAFLKNYLKLSNDTLPVSDTLPFAALQESLKLHNKTVDPLMLLCALCASVPEGHIVQDIFFNLNVDLEKIEAIASWLFNLEMLVDDYHLFKKLAKYKPDNEVNKGLTSVPTYYLDRYSRDLTRAAKHGALPLTLGRGDDLHEIFKLFSSGQTNLLIKGPVGAGRTTLVDELAYKMAAEQVPQLLEDKRLVRLELSAIVSGKYNAEVILVNAVDEAARSGNIVLVIEDIHQLSRTQTSQGLSLLEILTNFLESSNLPVIATTTIEDYTDYLRVIPNFDQLFTSYELIQLSRSSVLLAACIRASLLEAQNKCFFRFSAIEAAVDLTDQYIKGMSQPQKAISVLVEAATKAKNSAAKNKVISEDTIQRLVSEKTHIPTQAISQNESGKLLGLENELAKYIVGQQAAVKAVAEGLRRSRSGLGSSSRPLGSFLFLGPTGVGKTEIAKTLARVYFGDEKFMLRVDMSEFSGADALEKFLGTESRKTDTPIVKHIKNYPFCLLLLDEFEKASPEIINLFLQILDDGRLTTGKGELLDLTQCMVIATSNAGTGEIQEGIRVNKTLDQIKTQIFNQVLTRFFPPELLNRFDGVILFSPLSQEEVERITALQLNYLSQQLLTKGVKISFTENVIRDITINAFDPLLGARPIRRYIQDHVESYLAKLLLSKKLARGSTLTIDLQNGEYVAI